MSPFDHAESSGEAGDKSGHGPSDLALEGRPAWSDGEGKQGRAPREARREQKDANTVLEPPSHAHLLSHPPTQTDKPPRVPPSSPTPEDSSRQGRSKREPTSADRPLASKTVRGARRMPKGDELEWEGRAENQVLPTPGRSPPSHPSSPTLSTSQGKRSNLADKGCSRARRAPNRSDPAREAPTGKAPEVRRPARTNPAPSNGRTREVDGVTRHSDRHAQRAEAPRAHVRSTIRMIHEAEPAIHIT